MSQTRTSFVPAAVRGGEAIPVAGMPNDRSPPEPRRPDERTFVSTVQGDFQRHDYSNHGQVLRFAERKRLEKLSLEGGVPAHLRLVPPEGSERNRSVTRTTYRTPQRAQRGVPTVKHRNMSNLGMFDESLPMPSAEGTTTADAFAAPTPQPGEYAALRDTKRLMMRGSIGARLGDDPMSYETTSGRFYRTPQGERRWYVAGPRISHTSSSIPAGHAATTAAEAAAAYMSETRSSHSAAIFDQSAAEWEASHERAKDHTTLGIPLAPGGRRA